MAQNSPVDDTGVDAGFRDGDGRDHLSRRLESEPLFRRLVTAVPVGVLVLDADGTVSFANDLLIESLGYPVDKFVGESFAEFVVDDRYAGASPVDGFEESDRLDVSVRCGDGSAVTLGGEVHEFALGGDRFIAGFVRIARREANGRGTSGKDPEPDPAGEFDRRRVSDHGSAEGDEAFDRRDENGRHEAIDRRVAIDRYEAIAQMTGYGIYQLDRDGRFEMVNDAIVDMVGYSREELLGADTSMLVDDDTISRCEAAIEELLETEEERVATLECEVRTADDQVIPCEARITLLQSEATIQGTVGIVRDISERKERMEELRQERGLIEHVLETSPVGIGVITPDGDISRVNNRAEELLGLTMEELSSQTFDVTQRKLYDSDGHRVSPEDLLSRVFDDHERVLNSEFTLERPDGERVWAAISIAPMTDANGEVGKAVIIATDITDRKEREETLQQERDVIEHILGTSPVGIGVITPDGDISRVNDQAEELLGLTIEEITNQTLDVSQRKFYGASGQRVPPEDLLSRVFDDHERVLNSEFTLERPDGKRVWTALSIAPIENPAGEVEKAVVIATDISDRKERERRLRESEARLRQIAENINSAIWMADADLSEVLYVNPAYETIAGRSRDSVFGNLMNHLDAVHPQDRKRVEEAVKQVRRPLRDGSRSLRFQEKYRIVRPDGSIRWVNSFAFPLQNDDGEVYRFVGVIDDITEVKEQQLELGRQRDELETLNQINTVIRRVNQGLVQATTRKEIERQVCETLTDSKLYHAAWIGAADGEGHGIEPKTGVGIGGDDMGARSDGVGVGSDDMGAGSDGVGIGSDGVGSSTDIESSGPVSMRVESGDITILRDLEEGPPELTASAPDEKNPSLSGRSFAAAIPLVYKETVYDVLVAYSSRANAFGVREQAVLLELGKTIGMAINAVERKKALLTDTVVELEFAVHDRDVFFVSASEDGATFDLEGISSQSDGSYLQYYTVTGKAPDWVLERAEGNSSIERARLVNDHDDAVLLEFLITGPSLSITLAEYGASVDSASFAGGSGRIVATLPQTADVRNVVDAVRTSFARSELISKQERERSVQTNREFRSSLEDALTDRQKASLETAYYAGYFEWPRDSSGEDVADSLDVAPATFHQHVRGGTRKLVEALIEDPNVE